MLITEKHEIKEPKLDHTSSVHDVMSTSTNVPCQKFKTLVQINSTRTWKMSKVEGRKGPFRACSAATNRKIGMP